MMTCGCGSTQAKQHVGKRPQLENAVLTFPGGANETLQLSQLLDQIGSEGALLQKPRDEL